MGCFQAVMFPYAGGVFVGVFCSPSGIPSASLCFHPFVISNLIPCLISFHFTGPQSPMDGLVRCKKLVTKEGGGQLRDVLLRSCGFRQNFQDSNAEIATSRLTDKCSDICGAPKTGPFCMFALTR